ncbi:MAG: hypothetical protein IJU35_08115 [Paludibacteraceae bacterium]|nr:hypothetical protein [Paludibacteraceae bacterium]
MAEKKNNYKWTFQNVGGTTRVCIQSGEDIRHLGELDQKMWTVLSCPVEGLETDTASMRYADMDGDGKIHVNDVVKTSQWLCEVLRNPDDLLEAADSIKLTDINTDSEEGQKLHKSAQQILSNLGKEGDIISVADTSDSIAIFAKTRYNGDGIITPASADNDSQREAIEAAIKVTAGVKDRSGEDGVNSEQIEAFYTALAEHQAWLAAKPALPFGDDTDNALAAYNALDAKVRDYFLRNKLAAYSAESTAALDVQTASIEAISADNLTEKTDQIAAYPIARITGNAEIDLAAPVNPAWAAPFATLKAIAFPKAKTLSESDWTQLGAQFAEYTAWLAAKKGECVEALEAELVAKLAKENIKDELLAIVEKDKALEEEANAISTVDRLTHLRRDFFTLLKNFVTLQDFYSPDKDIKAVFQAGTLMIDQRACHLCLRVTDAGAHAAMAPASGMYLIYCDCRSKAKPGVMPIVAAMTVGETGDLMVGKHAIFYDRDGLDWDATITKIVENPISIRQAFWSPYRRMAKWVEDFINKRAAEKDNKVMGDATAKLATEPAPADPNAPKAAQPFDIAKFAGIFAAIGMALGMIGTALVSVAKGFVSLTWWQGILVVLGILLVISGPSMIMAWLKLRKRNIAPLLNANGWAVNASSIVNIPFGATLTEIAKYPIVKLKDPYAKKGLSGWQITLITLLIAALVCCGLWLADVFCNWGLHSPLCEPEPVEEALAENPDEALVEEPAAEAAKETIAEPAQEQTATE